jgi:hypothetical protein
MGRRNHIAATFTQDGYFFDDVFLLIGNLISSDRSDYINGGDSNSRGK